MSKTNQEISYSKFTNSMPKKIYLAVIKGDGGTEISRARAAITNQPSDKKTISQRTGKRARGPTSLQTPQEASQGEDHKAQAKPQQLTESRTSYLSKM